MNLVSSALLPHAARVTAGGPGAALEQAQRQQERAEDVTTAAIVVIGAIIVVGLVFTVFWIWTLIDAATTPDRAWSAVGQSKLVWLVVMFFFGVASIVYLFWPRPQLKAAAARD